MKITPALVKLFKQDQKAYGLKVAMTNLLWLKASKDLTDLGVKKLKTTYHKGG
jgi:hypothetical protein